MNKIHRRGAEGAEARSMTKRASASSAVKLVFRAQKKRRDDESSRRSAVLAAVSGRKQPRSPPESHRRKLLTAAHTYCHNGSRITSCSDRASTLADDVRSAQPARRPCQAAI